MSVETESLVVPTARRKLEYRPSLDGMRGVAVAGVVAFHLGHLQGGFLGVDLFFTLSGYLITRLLLLEHESTGRVALGAFWSRRAWRLLPALYLLLAALAVYAAVFARPDELDGIRGPGVASLLFVANWWFIGSGNGYWDIFAAPSPLEHVWSLAIEQQFYVVWPLLVAPLLGARRHLGRLMAVAVGLAIASTVWLGVLAADDVSRAYFGSFARSSSILIGAALAVAVHRGDRWVEAFARSRVAPWVGIAAAGLLAASWVAVDGSSDLGWYRGGFLLHAVAVAAIIAVLTHRPDGPATRLLSLGPVRGLGVVSYGFYLWHWPVIVILDGERTGLSGFVLLFVRLAVAMAATLASYFLLERPARQVLAKRMSALIVFPVAGVVIAIALVASTVAPPVRQSVERAAAASADRRAGHDGDRTDAGRARRLADHRGDQPRFDRERVADRRRAGHVRAEHRGDRQELRAVVAGEHPGATPDPADPDTGRPAARAAGRRLVHVRRGTRHGCRTGGKRRGRAA